MDWLKSILAGFASVVSLAFPQPTFTEGLVGQPVNLLPPLVETEVDRQVSSLIFRGLTKYTAAGDILPDLADSWEISENGKIYTITLKNNIYWHDGVPITSDDVLYTASISPILRNVALDRLDNKKVRFYLQDPFAPFLQVLSLGLIPAHLPNQDPLKPIGSGQFKIVSVSKDVLVTDIVLINLDSGSYFKRVRLKFYLNEDDLETAGMLGEIDAYGGWLIDGWELFNKYESTLKGRYYGIFFNLKSGPEILKNKDFRKDLYSAAPKELIIKNALGGRAAPISSPLAGSWAADNEAKEIMFNPDLKKEYGQKLTLTVPDKPNYLAIAVLLKKSWSNLGVDVIIRPEPTETLQEKIVQPRLFEAIILAQESPFPDPDRYALWHSTQARSGGLNITGFEAVRADKALELGRKVSDQNERMEHYQNFQRILADEVPAIYLFQPVYTYYVKKNIANVSLNEVFFAKDRWQNFNSWVRK